jgi:hypothetical protein
MVHREGAEDGHRSADVVEIGVCQHEGIERASPVLLKEWHDKALARIELLRRRACVDQDPAAVWGAHRDCVTLPNVDEMDLELSGRAAGGQGPPEHNSRR